jgi:hypothetical protein
MATGLAGAILLPVLGCSVGAAQVVRGIYNTPEAMAESVRLVSTDLCLFVPSA